MSEWTSEFQNNGLLSSLVLYVGDGKFMFGGQCVSDSLNLLCD